MPPSSVRGWIYVLTNASMPGLVKVGFSLKDPSLRAAELEGTGVPHPFLLAYEALVHAPRDLEQRVHRRLSNHREAKEFFRCEAHLAIDAIRAEATDVLLENNRLPKSQSSDVNLLEETREEPELNSSAAPERGTEKDRRSPELPAARSTEAVKHGTRLRFSAAYRGKCFSCEAPICVTVTHHERGTHCPRCNKFNDLSSFVKTQFGAR